MASIWDGRGNVLYADGSGRVGRWRHLNGQGQFWCCFPLAGWNLVCHAVKGRLRMLETLRQMIYFLKGEITYSRAPWRKPRGSVENGSGTLWGLFEAAPREFIWWEGESTLQGDMETPGDEPEYGFGPHSPGTGGFGTAGLSWGSIWGIWMWTCRNGPWKLYLEQLDLTIKII